MMAEGLRACMPLSRIEDILLGVYVRIGVTLCDPRGSFGFSLHSFENDVAFWTEVIVWFCFVAG